MQFFNSRCRLLGRGRSEVTVERTRRIWVGWAMSSALLIACGTTHGDASTRKLEMRLVSESGASAERVASWSGDPLPLEREVLVSGRDVESVDLVTDPGAETHSISMQLT